MKKLAKLKFINIFLAAILFFNQTASLPVAIAQTTVDSTSTLPYINYSTPYTTPSTTYTALTSTTTDTTYVVPTPTIPATTAEDDSNITFENILPDSISLSILNINFISPPTKVSGQPNFSVTTSEPAEVIFYIYKDGSEINKFNSIDRGNNTYAFTWDSTLTPNGQYIIKASAKKPDYIDVSKQINITVENATSTLGNNINNTQTAVPSYYELTFLEAYRPPLSGEKRITVSLNKDVDSVYFSIAGPRNEKYSGIKDNFRQYYFLWNTSKFPDGYYKITAEAMLSGQIKTYKSFGIQIVNSLSETTTTNTIIKTTVETPQPIYEKRATVEIRYECQKANIATEEECQKFMNIPPDCRDRGILSQEECKKFQSIPPDCRDKGFLSQDECNKYMAIPPQCREKGILDQEKCKEYSYRFSMPTECQKAGVTTPEQCNKIIFQNSLPTECQKDKVTSKEECEKILKNQTALTTECQKANIKDANACNEYMSKNFMTPECKEAGIATMEECNYFQRGKVNNLKVVVKVEVKTEKGIEIKEVGLPEECQQAGATSAEECDKIMFKKNAPQECLDANIDTAKECEKYIFEKSAPKDCKEAGISTMDACKKYMFEKYNGAENVPADKLPIECQKAGVKTSQDCDKVMRAAYLPKECQNQGITDEGKCNLYMQQKYLPAECQKAGVKTSNDCNKVMFKKYGPKECLTAGIDDEKECESFMFNKYSQQVTCQNIDEWQCQNSIQERHLGNIVATQTQFQELKNKVIYLAGESITGDKLNESLDTAKNILPLIGTSANFKIIKTAEKIILDDSDNLTQTSPMALMVDSDQDGLPDDMEKIIGTDPNNPDTDGDGYMDGVELKNNYDPTG
ncbi:MAG: hypothetical protein WC447_03555, partial [Candidatus Paceibacterota bacterium]